MGKKLHTNPTRGSLGKEDLMNHIDPHDFNPIDHHDETVTNTKFYLNIKRILVDHSPVNITIKIGFGEY